MNLRIGPHRVTDVVISGDLNISKAAALLVVTKPFLIVDNQNLGSLRKVTNDNAEIHQMGKEDNLCVLIKFPNNQMQATFASQKSLDDFVKVLKELKGIQETQRVTRIAEIPTPISRPPRNDVNGLEKPPQKKQR